VTGDDELPLVGPPPWLSTVIWYSSAASPWRKALATALSAVRSGRPSTGVSGAMAVDGAGLAPPLTVTALVTCRPAVESWVPYPAVCGRLTVSVTGG
jgi:hypothetical protein